MVTEKMVTYYKYHHHHHYHLKEETLDRTQWRPRFGRGYKPVWRRTTGWM